MGLAFSLNEYKIYHSENDITAIAYYPEITFNSYMVVHPIKAIAIIPRFEYLGSRYANTEASAVLEGYSLVHLKVSADIGKYISVSAGIENILDTLYEIKQYFPMEGGHLLFRWRRNIKQLIMRDKDV
ncbi:MAG: hypothetical protein LBT13_04870 [Treponema sp.]|jgi:outer membrane receptor for ferrienterochelin and colicin|nr:hypothetical protein [Treponema sp.]